ncbi:unnamed protein product [Pleuronectes platessa]|uniref:Uncharacterized protein n=1 Tax=Pleuronectes platessa TaxID=8262 RepID=A0A9N7UNQ1_PLEPL|nr:unnamed protein product [Pleuronectes platessa]
MRSERGAAEQTALARGWEQCGEGERGAGMMDYSSQRSVGDRLPRWICISPEPGRVGTSGVYATRFPWHGDKPHYKKGVCESHGNTSTAAKTYLFPSPSLPRSHPEMDHQCPAANAPAKHE